MIPCAVAQNIQTMLVARFLDGLAGSAFLSVAGGTVGDMFGKHVSLLHARYPSISDATAGAICAYDGLHSQPVCRPRGWASDRWIHR
jgi:MFS family permease